MRCSISKIYVLLTKEDSVSCNCFAASSVKIPSCKCCEQHLLPGGSITFCSTKAVVLHNCEITTSLEPDFLHIQQYACDFEVDGIDREIDGGLDCVFVDDSF